MPKLERFICPHSFGEKTDVTLLESRESRFDAIREGFVSFEKSPKSRGLRFTIPESLLVGCASVSDLRRIALPYQAEVLAVQLEHLLGPALFHDFRKSSLKSKTDSPREDIDIMIADEIHFQITEEGFPPPAQLSDIAEWITRPAPHFNYANFVISVGDVNSAEQFGMLAHIGQAGITFFHDQNPVILNSNETDRSTFHFVMSPFHSKNLPGHSEQTQIIVTRKSDVAKLLPGRRENTQAVLAASVHAAGMTVGEDYIFDGGVLPG